MWIFGTIFGKSRLQLESLGKRLDGICAGLAATVRRFQRLELGTKGRTAAMAISVAIATGGEHISAARLTFRNGEKPTMRTLPIIW